MSRKQPNPPPKGQRPNPPPPPPRHTEAPLVPEHVEPLTPWPRPSFPDYGPPIQSPNTHRGPQPGPTYPEIRRRPASRCCFDDKLIHLLFERILRLEARVDAIAKNLCERHREEEG